MISSALVGSLSHLVLEVNRGVEVGNFDVGGLAHHFTFAGVHETAEFWFN